MAVVYYDENGNGRLDLQEGARVAGVEVSVGGRTARAERVTGRAVVAGVPGGMQTVSIRGATLPPYYVAGPPVTVQVPQTVDVLLPVTLPIGSNEANTYMAFGDSITFGDGSSDGSGYRNGLEMDLQGFFGRAFVANQALQGGSSSRGADRIDNSLNFVHPAYTIVLYGTNDWNTRECQAGPPCFTIDSLRGIVRTCRASHSLPVLGTILPVNVGFDARVPPERQEWVAQMNDLIRPMAREEGTVVADLHAAFLREGNLSQLFVDHVHPNDRGYAIISREFFRAISEPAPVPGVTFDAFEPFGLEAPGKPEPAKGPERQPGHRRGGVTGGKPWM